MNQSGLRKLLSSVCKTVENQLKGAPRAYKIIASGCVLLSTGTLIEVICNLTLGACLFLPTGGIFLFVGLLKYVDEINDRIETRRAKRKNIAKTSESQ